MVPKNRDCGSTRRRFLQGATAFTAGTALSSLTGLRSNLALAQDPPVCPAAPAGGTPFIPGSDTRPIALRKPVKALSATEVVQLQMAFTKLRALPTADNRRWLLEADIHALFCDQCGGSSMQIHDSWNFFPWHRAYLYYYERILGSLVGDLDNFRLPYWDWENSRSMPTAYLTPGNNGNPLWDANRDTAIAGGGPLQASDGTAARINTLFGIADFATFGGAADIGGACETDPHNVVHGDVGPPAPPFKDMGNLGYAARDPIFFGHHGNIDKLWSAWNARASVGTDFRNPTDPSFLDVRWSFYDETQRVVSISAADVLDHKTNLRYTYAAAPITTPPILHEIFECELVCCIPGPDPDPFLKVSQEVRNSLLALLHESNPIVLVLRGVEVPAGTVGAFDVVAVRGAHRTQIGTLTVLANTMSDGRRRPITLVLDISKAAPDLLAAEKPASIRLLARHAAESKAKPFVLRAQSAQLRAELRKSKSLT